MRQSQNPSRRRWRNARAAQLASPAYLERRRRVISAAIALIMAVLRVPPVMAQDTVYWGDDRYNWDWISNYAEIHDWFYDYDSDSIIGSYNIIQFCDEGYLDPNIVPIVVDRPMTFHGLALVLQSDAHIVHDYIDINGNPHYANDLSAIYFPIYLARIDPITRHPVFIDSITYSPTKLVDARKKFKILDYYIYDTCQNISMHRYDTIFEFYFDNPIVLDSDDYDTLLICWDKYMHLSLQYDDKSLCYAFSESVLPEKFMMIGHNINISDNLIQVGTYSTHYAAQRLVRPILVEEYIPIVPDTVLPCPRQPQPTLLETTATTASVMWDRQEGATGYEVALGTNTADAEANPIHTYSASRTIEVFTNLEPNTGYACWVRSVCHHQCDFHDSLSYGDWSPALSIFTLPSPPDTNAGDTTGPGPTLIHDPQLSDLRLYPNPATDELTVESPTEPILAVELLDAKGILLQRLTPQSPHSFTLPLADLPPAPYLLRLQSPSATTTRRFIKQ